MNKIQYYTLRRKFYLSNGKTVFIIIELVV